LAPVKYIFVDSQKEKAIELKDKLDAFKDEFDRHLAIEILAKQGLVFVPDIHNPTQLIHGFYQQKIWRWML